MFFVKLKQFDPKRYKVNVYGPKHYPLFLAELRRTLTHLPEDITPEALEARLREDVKTFNQENFASKYLSADMHVDTYSLDLDESQPAE